MVRFCRKHDVKVKAEDYIFKRKSRGRCVRLLSRPRTVRRTQNFLCFTSPSGALVFAKYYLPLVVCAQGFGLLAAG